MFFRKYAEKIKEMLKSESFDAVYKMLAIITAMCLVFSYALTVSKNNKKQEYDIKAYIKGEVVNPGVYTLKSDSRIQDLIDAAGGFTDTAEANDINLAERIIDEEVIVVPKRKINTDAQLININTASKEQLDSLPGIGKAMAERIIEHRDKYGRFKKIEYIMNVKGIGEAQFEDIKNLITVY